MKKILIILTILLLPGITLAADFNKNKIITDDDLTNFHAMSLERIQSFLESKGGMLASYKAKDMDGNKKLASEIIYNAAQQYLLSPKFLLVTLQKEASLVTKKTASNSLLDKALGFGCPDGGGCSSKYSGFANQMYSAANKVRNSYWEDLSTKNSTISGWGVGVKKNASDGVVTPENKATAILYTYTPWIGYHGGNSSVGGNSLFWDLWVGWFGTSNEITTYPTGSLLQSNESGIIYLVKDGSKLPFTSLGALVSNYNINKTIVVNESVLDQYDEGLAILFPNYTLLQAPNGAIYLYVNGQKRGITSKKIFQSLGYNPEEVLPATWKELDNIAEGPLVSEKDIFPGGALLQNKETGAIVFVDENNKRHPIWAKDILESNFKGIPVFPKEEDEIKQYKKSSPLKLADGELVTSPGSDSVYIIDNGKKRAFKSKKVFDKLGYKWDNIMYTSDEVLNLHNKGKQVKLKTTKKKSTSKKKKK